MASGRIALARILPISVLVVAIVAVPVMVFSPSGIERLSNLRQEKREVDEEVSRQNQEIRRLRAEVDRLRADPRAVERAARSSLGLVRQTEVVFQFER